jgi:hypothetical protein
MNEPMLVPLRRLAEDQRTAAEREWSAPIKAPAAQERVMSGCLGTNTINSKFRWKSGTVRLLMDAGVGWHDSKPGFGGLVFILRAGA